VWVAIWSLTCLLTWIEKKKYYYVHYTMPEFKLFFLFNTV